MATAAFCTCTAGLTPTSLYTTGQHLHVAACFYNPFQMGLDTRLAIALSGQEAACTSHMRRASLNRGAEEFYRDQKTAWRPDQAGRRQAAFDRLDASCCTMRAFGAGCATGVNSISPSGSLR